MLSQIVSIVFAVGFISVVNGLNAEESAAYKEAFKCFKAGHDVDRIIFQYTTKTSKENGL